MKEGLIFNHEVCNLTEANEFMPRFYSFPVHLTDALRQKIFSWILLLAGLFLSFYTLNYHSIYDKMNFAFFANHQMHAEDFYHILSSVMIIYAVIQLEVLHKIFNCTFFKLVGKYPFSLYAIHIPIIFSIGGIVFLKLFQAGYSSGFCIFAGTFTGLLLTILATFLLHNYVDIPAGKLAKRFEKIFK